jgi:hypothetical protein
MSMAALSSPGQNGQHKLLTRSFGQLDEGGSKVKIEDGVLSIWDQ